MRRVTNVLFEVVMMKKVDLVDLVIDDDSLLSFYT